MKKYYNLAFYPDNLCLMGIGLIILVCYLTLHKVKETALLLPVVSMEQISMCGPASGNAANSNVGFLQDNDFTFADTAKITWTTVAPQPVKNSEAQAVVVAGKMYSFGGFDKLKRCCTPTERAYVFDPVANSWTAIKDMPAQNGTAHGGVTHAGFTTDGVDIYFAGGYTSNANGYGQIFGTKEVWKYDVSENDYSRLPDFPEPLSAGELEYVNGKLHWIGGTNLARTQDLGTHYVLDLSNLSQGWTSLAPLPNPRNHLGSAVFEEKIYIFGGQHGHDAKLITQNDVHMYDPATDKWTQKADMPRALSHITGATFTFGDRIFIIGGEMANGPDYYVKDVVAYNPLSDTWTKFTSLPSKRTSGVADVIDGVIYYSTGYGSVTTWKGVLEDTPPPVDCTPTGIWLEAECGSRVGSNWQVAEVQHASEGSYITAKADLNSVENAPVTEADVVSYNFTVEEAGAYRVYGRIQAPDQTSNSFWIRIDEGEWMVWSLTPLTEAEAFNWFEANTYNLGTGNHKIDISYREAGTWLDKLLISSQNCLPKDQGEAAPNCSEPTNQPPVANAGEDQTVDADSKGVAEVSLDGSASTDTDGSIVSYLWKKGDEQIATGEKAQVKLPTGTHEITLQVKDNHGITASDVVTITVEEQQNPEFPVAHAGKDTTIYADENGIAVVMLDGSASAGRHGEIISYLWKKADEPLAEGVQPEVALSVGMHEIILEVEDNHGLTATDTVAITVEEALPAAINLWLEAECADTLGSKWIQVEDASASEGAYITAREGLAAANPSADNIADRATYHFTVAESGSYYLFGRIKVAANAALWVRVDQGNWISWQMNPAAASGAFTWMSLQDQPLDFATEGTHQIEIITEQGNALDKFLLSSVDMLPEASGEAANNCDGSTIIVATEDPLFTSEDVIVFPNPGKGIYTIQLNRPLVSAKSRLTVSTMEGRLVKQMNLKFNISHPITVNLEDVAPGIYLLQLWMGEETIVKRIEKL